MYIWWTIKWQIHQQIANYWIGSRVMCMITEPSMPLSSVYQVHIIIALWTNSLRLASLRIYSVVLRLDSSLIFGLVVPYSSFFSESLCFKVFLFLFLYCSSSLFLGLNSHYITALYRLLQSDCWYNLKPNLIIHKQAAHRLWNTRKMYDHNNTWLTEKAVKYK